MQKESILYGIIGLLAGSLITIVLAANAVNNNNSGMMQMMGMRQIGSQNTGHGTMMGNIDRHFIEQMIPHHEDAITMANIALEKASHPEIKRLAKNIVKTQSDEITKMKGWYKDWFGTEVPQNTAVMGQHGMMQGDGMHMGMVGDETDVENLRNASDFDKAFIQEMIPHHQMAVMMAQMLKNTTNRKEMGTLADNIISAQAKEINEMRGWYKAWGY
jgi:uncharacterized protein (DUF305 family)